jgi:hypothetical protein
MQAVNFRNTSFFLKNRELGARVAGISRYYARQPEMF